MHTYHHRRMADVSKAVFYEELKQSELAYQEATGRPAPVIIRFPYASYQQENLEWLRAWNYVVVEGEDTVDWSGPPSAELVERVTPWLTRERFLCFMPMKSPRKRRRPLNRSFNLRMIKDWPRLPYRNCCGRMASKQANVLGKSASSRSFTVRFNLSSGIA